MELKMYLHEDYTSSEMEEVYVEQWEDLGIPRDVALRFVDDRPTYEVTLVLEYSPDDEDFRLVRVEGFDGRSYDVVPSTE